MKAFKIPKGRRWFGGLLCFLAAALCGGCAWISSEEPIRQDLLEQQKQEKKLSYKTAVAKRGDLTIYTSLTCKATCDEETSLQFGESGLAYGDVFVSVGDTVKKGDVLAQLDMSEIDDTLAEAKQQYQLKELEVQDYAVQIADLNRIASLGGISAQEKRDSLKSLTDARTSSSLEKSLARAQYEEALQEKRNRQIIADHAGVVTWIFDPSSAASDQTGEALSNREQDFIKLSSGQYQFTCKTQNYLEYPVGTQVDMEIENRKYRMEVADVELSEKSDDEQQQAQLTFAFVEEAYDITRESVGYVNQSEYLKDVLYVPKEAVVTLQEESYVYVQDEDGMRTARKVQTGKSDGVNMVISSGLDEGETVILE